MLRQSVILRSKFPSLGGVVRSTGVVLKSAQAPLAPKLIHKNRPRGCFIFLLSSQWFCGVNYGMVKLQLQGV